MDAGELGFRAVLEAAPDAMVIVDAEGTITLVNEQAEQLFGYSRDELVGRSVDVLVPDRFRGGHGRLRATYVGQPHRRPMGAGMELTGLRRGGSEFPVEISLSPLEVDGSTHVISAIRDVSDRRRAAAITARAAQQAAVAEVGRLALEGGEVEELLALACAQVAEVLGLAHADVSIRRVAAGEMAPEEADGAGALVLPMVVRGRTVGTLGVRPSSPRNSRHAMRWRPSSQPAC